MLSKWSQNSILDNLFLYKRWIILLFITCINISQHFCIVYLIVLPLPPPRFNGSNIMLFDCWEQMLDHCLLALSAQASCANSNSIFKFRQFLSRTGIQPIMLNWIPVNRQPIWLMRHGWLNEHQLTQVHHPYVSLHILGLEWKKYWHRGVKICIAVANLHIFWMVHFLWMFVSCLQTSIKSRINGIYCKRRFTKAKKSAKHKHYRPLGPSCLIKVLEEKGGPIPLK